MSALSTHIAFPVININGMRDVGSSIHYNWWTYMDASWSPSVHTLHYSWLLVMYILWVWTNVKWHVPLCPENPLCSAFSSLSTAWPPNLWLYSILEICYENRSVFSPRKNWSFTVFIVLPLSECHIVGIVQYAAFFGLDFFFFSLSNMSLNFFCVFSWLGSSFLFSTECYTRVHLSVHFGCFQGLIINNKAALSIYVQVFL